MLMDRPLVSCLALGGLLLTIGWLAGCGPEPEPPKQPKAAGWEMGSPQHIRQIKFADVAESNADKALPLQELKFTDIQGQEVALKDYVGKKNVLLIITRGATQDPYYSVNGVCIYCTAQTSRLIARYQEIADRDTEVVVVFPVKAAEDSSGVNNLVEAARKALDAPPEQIPFPLLLDVKLAAVDQLKIQADLAKPATYILDKEGQVQFAFVGEDAAQRPSMESILKQLDRLKTGL